VRKILALIPRKTASISFVFCLQILSAADVLDCAKKSLIDEVNKAKPGESLSFTGLCSGPLAIRVENLELRGVGAAVVDGGSKDAIVVAAPGAKLANFEVRNGANGILGQNGASLEIEGVVTRQNALSGISLQTGSSAMLKNVTTRENRLHGLDLQTGSSASVTGTFAAIGNRVFGANVNGSSLTFATATASFSGNALGMQVATAGNAFLNDPATTLEFTSNLATGLTVVSGAHMVSFGGKITSSENGAFGVTVNSKAGLDLDAGSVLTVSKNRAGGLALQQSSVMTVFNNPQSSGVPGFSTISSSANGGNGVAVLTGSTLNLANQAQIISTGNAIGLNADNGAGLTLRNTSLSGNTAFDLSMTFGTRVDVQVNLTVGNYRCDATVLTRGGSLTCPK
jgi:hypothetical protein